jgi:hypothetical protein
MVCIEHLRARVAKLLEPPANWKRANKVKCQCPHCIQLSRFLADPERQVWAFKGMEAARKHVEDTIRATQFDLDTRTDRRARPYTLVCTKN